MHKDLSNMMLSLGYGSLIHSFYLRAVSKSTHRPLIPAFFFCPDEGISFDRTVDPEEVDDKPEEVEMEKEGSDGVDGSAVERISTGDILQCSKRFIVCCLDRKILSEKCDCLAGR